MVYLDNAATCLPKPPGVCRAFCEGTMKLGNPGRSGHAPAIQAGRAVIQCREALAELLGVADPLRIVFCGGCTDALNQAIKGSLDLGAHVITSALEHNSVLRPLHALHTQGVISLSILAPRQNGRVHPDDLYAAMRPNTRLCVLTHASNVTGAIQDIEAVSRLCHRQGVPLLVDGAQYAGCMPLQLDALPGVALYALAGHKGLLGPQGCGALYIRKGVALRPLREGGTGSQSLLLTQPADMPDLYESGTQPAALLAAWREGIRYVQGRQAQISGREQALYTRLRDGLGNIPHVRLYAPPNSTPCAGVLCLNIRGMEAAVAADTLWRQYGIACRAGLHCAPLAHQWMGTQHAGAVRLSIGPFNSRRDIDQALYAVQDIARQSVQDNV